MGEMFVLRKWFLAKKKVLQVFEALPAKERECRKEMWMFTMWFGGITQRASAFSAGTASSRSGRCSDKTRPFFADSHWEAEPYLFCSNQSQRSRVTSYQREVSGQVTGRLSVPYQSSFGELRMGPRLRDTLDTGLCCSSQGRGQLSQVIYKLSQVIYKVMSTSIYNLPHRHFWVPFAVSQWFPFVQHIRQGKQDGYPTNLDRLTYFQTHGELHKGPCTFSLPGTNNLPRHLCTPAATSYLRFIMDAQRPWPHFVQLNGLPDQMPEVAKDRERLEVSLPSSKCFAEAHASSTWAVSSALPAQPSLGSTTSS